MHLESDKQHFKDSSAIFKKVQVIHLGKKENIFFGETKFHFRLSLLCIQAFKFLIICNSNHWYRIWYYLNPCSFKRFVNFDIELDGFSLQQKRWDIIANVNVISNEIGFTVIYNKSKPCQHIELMLSVMLEENVECHFFEISKEDLAWHSCKLKLKTLFIFRLK